MFALLNGIESYISRIGPVYNSQCSLEVIPNFAAQVDKPVAQCGIAGIGGNHPMMRLFTVITACLDGANHP